MVEKFQKKYIDALRENKDMRPITNADMLIKRLYERNISLAVASSARREKGIK
jgi:phosphoglycolate phosphatase-like HAD superfamily hydrolase